MSNWEKLLPSKKAYDQYHYDSADDASQIADANRELRRQGERWHYIGQGTKVINNGIYFPIEDPANPIEVDFTYGSSKNPAIYDEYFRDVNERLRRLSYREVNMLFLPKAVALTVSDRMNKPSRPQPEALQARPFKLSDAMREGGSYLEATLAGAALLDALTPGVYTSVETTMRFNQDDVEDREIRRFIRYEDPRSGGERITVIDFKDGVCDRLEETVKRSVFDLKESTFDYRRPEDKRRFEPFIVSAGHSSCAITSLTDYVNKKRARESGPSID